MVGCMQACSGMHQGSRPLWPWGWGPRVQREEVEDTLQTQRAPPGEGPRAVLCAAPGWLSRDRRELALRVSRGQWLREAAEP